MGHLLPELEGWVLLDYKPPEKVSNCASRYSLMDVSELANDPISYSYTERANLVTNA